MEKNLCSDVAISKQSRESDCAWFTSMCVGACECVCVHACVYTKMTEKYPSLN